MTVPMMQIRIVRMPMAHRLVAVPRRVRFSDRSVVGMPMVVIMDMSMFVFERLMEVFVLVPFGEVHPEADRHQDAGGGQLRTEPVAEHGQRHEGADKGRQREIGPGSRRAQMP